MGIGGWVEGWGWWKGGVGDGVAGLGGLLLGGRRTLCCSIFCMPCGSGS